MQFPRNPVPELCSDTHDVEFQVIDWYIPDNDRILQDKKRNDAMNNDTNTEPDPYTIYMFGVTATGVTVCTKVTGFMPYFFVKPPPEWTDAVKRTAELKKDLLYKSVEKRWYNRRTKSYDTYMGTVIPKKFQSHLKYMKVVHRKDFVGFTNDTMFPYIKIRVSTMALFNVLKRYFSEPAQIKAGFKICESNLDPFLRFIHEKDIQPCGWVQIPAGTYSEFTVNTEEMEGDAFSRTNWNIEVDYNHVVALRYNRIAPLLVASFDIECTSSHGDFPVAKKDYKKLGVDLINAARYTKILDPDTLKQWIVDAFKQTVQVKKGVEINRLYPKSKVTDVTLNKALTDDFLDELMTKLAVAVKEKGSLCLKDEDDEDEEEEDVPKKKTDSAVEKDIINHLTEKLPPLKGDPIIQIGTTVNVFGSDQIVYKHIVTLNSCTDIEGAEVETYNNEGAVLLAWKEFITRLDPDIVAGYNILGFDMKYIWERAQETGVCDEFALGLGRIRNRKTALETKQLSSSALGDNIMYIIDMDGVVVIDQLKVTQRDEKLDSYKLDFVARHFLKDNKNDLKPREIFEKFGGTADDRAEIARYCLQDCALVNRLIHCRKVLENNVAMGNICFVPLKYLFMRGQGIKIFSLVAKECRAKQYIIPVLHKNFDENAPEDEEGYEGAIVLPPQTGMYLEDPITVMDYNSLYPSSMISRNISHDCYVTDDRYRDMEGVEYLTVEYDIYEGKGDKKHVVGKKSVTFAQLPDGKKGVMPNILMMLLDARKNTRKKMEFQTIKKRDGTEVSGLVNQTDTEYVLSNPESGMKVAVLKDDVVGEPVDTFTDAEKAILDARQLAYKITANSLYGQCGSRTSPIYLKEIAAATTATGREMICLARNFVETHYNAEVIYGDSVMPYTPITILKDGKISVRSIANLAKVWMPYPQFKAGELNRTHKEQSALDNVYTWTHCGWARIIRVIRHKTVKKIYRVATAHGMADVTEDHSLLAANHQIIKPGDCVAGTALLHSLPRVANLEMDMTMKLPDGFEKNNEIQTNEQVTAQELILQLQQRGYSITLTHDNSRMNTRYCIKYELGAVKDASRDRMVKDPEVLKEAYTGYVYDIETEYGMFHALGNLDVKNTDSIFCKFPVIDGDGTRLKGKQALPGAIKAGQIAAKEIKLVLPQYQVLAYEKTLFPFILFSKKRYVGNLYEDDPNAKPKQKSMGIALKRRDYAPIVKKVYGGIIDILLNNNDLLESVDFLKHQLQDLVDGKFPLEDLVISKTLKGEYKDPSKIAHRVLADRIGERDEGNKPMVNDRIPFVYINAPDAKLQGDRIEHPDYIRETGIKPDYQYYITNQLMKPITQLYALCVEDIPGYAFPPGYWIQRDIEMSDHRLYSDPVKRKDRIVALKMREVEDTLFRPFLTPKVVKRATKTAKITEVADVAKDVADVVKPEETPVVKKRATRKKVQNLDAGLTINLKIDKKSVLAEVTCGDKSLHKSKAPFKGDVIMVMTRELEGALVYVVEELKHTDPVNVQAPNEFKHIYRRACEVFSQDVVDWNEIYRPALQRQDVGLKQELDMIQNMNRLMSIKNKVTLNMV